MQNKWSPDDIRRAILLKKRGYTYAQIACKLGAVSKDSTRNIIRRNKDKFLVDEDCPEDLELLEGLEDEEEDICLEGDDDDTYEPKVNIKGNGYVISSRDREIVITEVELKRLKEMYCGAKLTINQVCRNLEIPRRDFIIIKNAFGITKDDIPFTDQEVLENDLDVLVDEQLLRQKNRFFLRFEEERIKQMERDLAAYMRKDYFLERIDELAQNNRSEWQPADLPCRKKDEGRYVLEIPIVDLHLGKLAWAPETGENFDYKIASNRFRYVIDDIIQRTSDLDIDKIIFPIGQDFFNFDTMEGETAAGTRQDNDVRWQKLFFKGEELLKEAIDKLRQIAPVRILYVPGNHDTMTVFYMIRTLYNYYKGVENVLIDGDPRGRKYEEFGKCLIGYAHGAKEKSRIYHIMQAEAPAAWGRTNFREWHVGHLHHETVDVKENSGVTVRGLSTVTGTDAWHYDAGYVGVLAKHQSFLWHKREGLKTIYYTYIE